MALGFKANELDENVLKSLINSSLTNLKDLLYPVGCIVQTTAYSTVSEMREAYGGNDWELITNRVLMGAGDTYSVGETGGSDSVTLTTANLPSHNHTYTRSSNITGSTTLTISQIPSHNHPQAYDHSGGYLPSSGIAHSITNLNNNGSFSDRSADYYDNKLLSDTGNDGSHTHSITRTSVNTGNTGSATAFNVTNSYYAVYVWTRIL